MSLEPMLLLAAHRQRELHAEAHRDALARAATRSATDPSRRRSLACRDLASSGLVSGLASHVTHAAAAARRGVLGRRRRPLSAASVTPCCA